MTSPFKETARALLDKGYSVIPIAPGAKYPGMHTGWTWKPLSWGKYEKELPSLHDIETWEKWPEAGIGIALGRVSGIVAVDFDDNVDGAHEKIAKVIPISPVKKVGKKGYTAFYRWKGETNKKWHPVVELLSSGNQTVIPPSIHKDTCSPYTWVDGVSLADVDKDDLPELPSDFVQLVDKILGREEKSTPPPAIDLQVPATQDEVYEALQYITPDCGYQEWLNIGMAIQSEFGDAGYSLWDNWSRGGSKYPKKGEPNTRTKWRSFKNTGIGIGTLFFYAQEAGYIAPRPPELDNVVILPGGNLKPATVAIKKKTTGIPRELLDAPGLVGDVANWITETAPYPQPILSLAASIALVGVIMGHKVQSPTRSRSNMLTMSVAPSGSGKDHPQQCVDILLRASGNDSLMGGDPVSSAGLLKSLKNGNGRRLVQIDEFGRVLKTLTNPRAAAHQSSITTVMMKLFSKAGTTYYGSEYADPNGDRGRDDIEQPCLCVHGATVPTHLYEAMTGSDAIDGFLSRWLIFESDYFPLDSRDVGNIDNPPEALLNKLRYWAEKKNGGGNLEGLTHFNVETVPYSPAAEEKARTFQREMRKRSIEHEEQHTGFAPIWARAYEHATKLALVAHENGVIDEDCINWACGVAEYCMQYLCDSVDAHISNNEQEKQTKQVLSIIRKHGDTLWRSDLTRATQRLKPRERVDILQTLVDSGQIEIVQETGVSGRPKIGYIAVD